MRSRPVLLEILRTALRDQMNGQPGGIRRDDRPRLAHAFDSFEQFALNLEILSDRFDNPVDLPAPCKIVFQISGRHEPRRFRSEKSRRARFFGCFQAGQHDPVPYCGAFERQALSFLIRAQFARDDIDQENRDTGVGQMRRDARTHRPGTQNSNLLDSLFHRARFMQHAS